MVEQDTIRLLRECDAGIQMGVAAIDEVSPRVVNPKLQDLLQSCRRKHNELDNDLRVMLDNCHDSGKNPNPMAKGMSWMKTNMKLAAEPTDNSIADLITDGCNMGVKSLGRYLNQYKAASEESKDIAKRLINIEEKLACDIRDYL